jgi:predicted nucleic acid-binding protein
MTGVTLDTGALIALESGNRRMAVLVGEALASGAELAIPAGVLAQAWRGGAAQARLARLLRASVTRVVPLDQRLALRVGARCAATGIADVVDVSVALCARDRGHPVVTSDPGDIRAADPSLTLLSPGLSRRQRDEPPAISNDHSSLLTPTGGGAAPPARSAADRCPCPNAGDCTHAWKASSSRHLVMTSQVARPSVGLSSSKPSKPSWLSTAPARAANRRASSSPLSAGTVIALILTTVIPTIMPGRRRPAGRG